MIKKLRQLFNDKDKVNKMLDDLESGYSIQFFDGLTISYTKRWTGEQIIIQYDDIAKFTEKE